MPLRAARLPPHHRLNLNLCGVNPLRNVTELSVDEALRDVTHRRRMARLLHDDCAVLVLTRQIDRLLDMRLERRAAEAPMIHR